MIALVVGHAQKGQGSDSDELGLTEYDFNTALAKAVHKRLPNDTIIMYRRNGYKALPFEINRRLKAYKDQENYCVSFHCNAFNKKATGTETLYFERSSRSKVIATMFQQNIVEALHLSDRGPKPKTRKQHGGYLLKKTAMPCIILEPFFIDNYRDVIQVLQQQDALADSIANSCVAMITGKY